MKTFRVLSDRKLVATFTISEVVLKTAFYGLPSKVVEQFRAEHNEYANTPFVYNYVHGEWKFDFYEITSIKFVED